MSYLELKINLPGTLEEAIKVLPCYSRKGLLLENLDWMSTNKTKGNTIQVDILSKDFYNMVNVNKNQSLLYIFLINQKSSEKFLTKYNKI